MVLLALLLAAPPPLEVTAVGRVELRLLRPNGTVAWKATTDGSVTGPCLARHTLEVRRLPNGAAQRIELSGDEAVRCEVDVRDAGSDRLLVFFRKFQRPPEKLQVKLVEADDHTGLGVFEITNDTTQTFVVDSIEVDRPEARGGDCRPRRQIEPHVTTLVSIGEGMCPRAQSGLRRRLLRLTDGFGTNEVSYEYSFEFVGLGGSPPVVLPTSKFHQLRTSGWWFTRGVQFVALDGTRACVCAGTRVGRTPHTIVSRRNGELCGLVVGEPVESCEWPMGDAENVGDFPFSPSR